MGQRSESERGSAPPERPTRAAVEAVVTTAPGVAYAIDRQGRLLCVSDAFCTLAHLQREQLIGRHQSEVFPDGTNTLLEEADRVVFTTGGIVRLGPEAVVVHGLPLGADMLRFPIKGSADEVDSVLGVTLGPDDPPRADGPPSSPRDRFSAIFDELPVGLVEADFSNLMAHLDGLGVRSRKDVESLLARDPGALHAAARRLRVLAVNRAYLELAEAPTSEELLGRIAGFLVSNIPEVATEHLVAVAERRTTYEVEAPLRTLKGNVRIVRRRVAVQRGHEATFDRVLMAFEDMTDRRHAEEAVRVSEARFRALFEVSQDAVVIADAANGMIVEVNNRAEELLERPKGELVGMHMARICPPADRMPPSRDGDPEAPRSAPGARIMQVETGTGDRFPVEMSQRIIKVGGRTLVQSIIRNLTEGREMERRAFEDRRRAELFLDLLGHDVNNLLQGILTSLQLLKMKGTASPQSERFVDLALEQAKRISALVKKVHKLSGLHGGGARLQAIDAIATLARAAEDVAGSHPARTVRIALPKADGPVLVMGNDLLHDVFANILDNAVKFDQHEVSDVSVQVRRTGDSGTWRFEFEDRGPGIADPMKERIFRRFSSNEDTSRGFGLGMAISDQLIKHMGGRLWVEDRVRGDHAQGSRFVVELPTAR